jgi:hypothetical protein
MEVGIISGQRYYRVGDIYYTPSAYNAEMWKEYLEVFDEVKCICLIRRAEVRAFLEKHLNVTTRNRKLLLKSKRKTNQNKFVT